jgi:hypothetical protein
LIPLPFFPLLSPCKSLHPMYIPLNHLESCYPLVNCHITNWKDPPCYSWLNPLFRLGHFQ